ncbi:sulfurtransferase [Flammeovirga aprica]|uniref:Sulfurtransferase n=1 Tax=Flammeovirga aprica JL-4 TaxID=694437 RepID=A0A7X9RVT3_9BACT|nr:sulfurtransferase [Flammeovirga aprica]NME69620.1 sulfurtransferase [Flammeovirga aprica JL-4]
MKNLISPQQLSEQLQDQNLIILDASQDGKAAGLATEYPDLMIEGARIFDIKNTFSDISSGLPNTFPSAEQFEKECQKLGINKGSNIVVYDNIGLFSSPRAWWMFQAMGHQNIKVLDGGLPAWLKEGFNTVSKPTTQEFEKGDFVAKLIPQKIRSMEEVVANISSESEVVVDARGKQRFDGTVEEPRPGMKSGHIPNAVNLPFKEILEDGKLKSQEELKSIFEEKVPSNQNLIFSCGSGITACILHLAASEILDVPMSIYDGSWSEWGQSENPIVKS